MLFMTAVMMTLTLTVTAREKNNNKKIPGSSCGRC